MSFLDDEVIQRRRQLAGGGKPVDAAGKWGLALSGGGIRSATFCFGLLRALAQRKLLLRFDLLSTVSGGGYIGTMLGSLLTRATGPNEARQVELALDGQLPATQGGGTQPASWFLWWLRANGRYLIPHGAKDRLYAIALFVRNLAGTHFELGLMAVLLGALLASVDLLVWGALDAAGHRYASRALFDALDALPDWWPTIWLLLAIPLLDYARYCAAYWSLAWVKDRARIWPWLTLVMLADGVFAWAWWRYGANDSRVGLTARHVLLGSSAGLALLWVAGAGTARRCLARTPAAPDPAVRIDQVRQLLTRRLTRRLQLALALVVLGLVDRTAWLIAFDDDGWIRQAGLTLAVIATIVRGVLPVLSNLASGGGLRRPVLMTIGRIAGFVLAFALAAWWASIVYQAALGSLFRGDGLQYGDAWIVLALLSVPIVAYVAATGHHFGFLNLSSLHVFYRARLVRSYMGAANPHRFGDGSDPLGALAATPVGMPARPGTAGTSAPLPASAGSRSVDDVSIDDDMALADYRPQRCGGPIHLINLCVNQTVDARGRQFNQDRRGLRLTIASGGRMRVAQEPWQPMPADSPLTVGRCMAISGAALAPGMGAATRSGLSALLTFAGIRLGYWSWPEERTTQAATGRRPWLAKSRGLLGEVMGRFQGTSRPDWFLSDGGHFENTGAYALLAERASVIVIADCGADPGYRFADLENLVRLARIDLQADIRFQKPRQAARALAASRNGPSGVHSGAHPPPELSAFGSINDLASTQGSACLALARITYGGLSAGQGILLLIKPNICAGLPVDLLNFKDQNPAFPQEPTADQFFSEAQWESYFLLGQYLGGHLSRTLIEQLADHADEFFEDDDCSPFSVSAVAARSGAAAASRLPSRLAAASAVGTTLGVGAVATIGVSVWQGLDSLRSAQLKQAEAERAALKELTDLWAELPASGDPPNRALPAGGAARAALAGDPRAAEATAKLAAALVRTADTLCPAGEAGWFVRSTIGAAISRDTIKLCSAIDPALRRPACDVLIESANPALRGRLPDCLAWSETRRESLPPPKYWAYDYSARREIDYWHPCDPRRRELRRAEAAHVVASGVLSAPQSESQYARAGLDGVARTCAVPIDEISPDDLVGDGSTIRPFEPPLLLDPRRWPELLDLKRWIGIDLSMSMMGRGPASAGPDSAVAPGPAGPAGPDGRAVAPGPAGRAVEPVPAPPDPAVGEPASGSASAPGAAAAPGCATIAGAQARALGNRCAGISVFVQVYRDGQIAPLQCSQAGWKEILGAQPLAIENVVRTARRRGRPDPAPVAESTIRYHGSDAIDCARALGPVIGKTWRVEPLSARLAAQRRTVEVWVAPREFDDADPRP